MKRQLRKNLGFIALLFYLFITSPNTQLSAGASAPENGSYVKVTSVYSEEESSGKLQTDTDGIQEGLGSYLPEVTVVRSINNTIKNAYYKPSISDIPLLEEKVLEEGGFVSAYTGFFDLDRSDPYKPEDLQARALEILGYDFLLDYEKYDGKNYTVIKTGDFVSYGTALMNTYKALGLSQYDVSLFYEPDHSLTIENNPAVKSLPSYIKEINTDRGKTNVFVTRTNQSLYYEKAEHDLNISRSGMDSYLSNGDFILLLKRMMHFYGEPVLSNSEMNLLLQVYGAEIPTYLTEAEKDAYLYLKSRGVLNVDINYRMPLRRDDMLDVLMCVYDKDSRVDYKKISVTMDIGDELINKGYFPRDLELSVGSSAIETEEEYNYSEAGYYDYYIEITDKTQFVDTEGSRIGYLFVPTIPTDETSPELEGSKYLGIIRPEDGKSYYHLIIPIQESSSDYMKRSEAEFGEPGYIQINTLDGSDYPTYMWFEEGGGVYFQSGKDNKEAAVLERREFRESEFEGSISKERKGAGTGQSFGNALGNAIASFGDILFGKPAIVKAATSLKALGEYMRYDGGPKVTITIYNSDNITGYDKSIPELEVGKEGNKLLVTLPAAFKSYFYSTITRDSSNIGSRAYPAISTMNGDVLLKYNDLVEAGIFYNGGAIPTPEDYDDQIIILDSAYGQIKINNETREIVVGNTLYKVKNSNTVLFKYVIENGKSVLWIDFRAAYGWTNNIVDIKVTGTGSSYSIHMQLLSTSNRMGTINLAEVTAPVTFKTYPGLELMQVIPKNVILDDTFPKAIMTSSYSLANWIIFEGVDRISGMPKDYVFVFYPENAFKQGDSPSGLEKMRDIVGYTVIVDGWVCRVFELNRSPNSKAGQFTYSEDFGYLYNLPDWNDFTMSQYLSGEYILPISEYGKQIINANVNFFEGYPYGSRPTKSPVEGIDIKGKVVKVNPQRSEFFMSAAPAGVSAFYGGAKRSFYTADSDILLLNQAINDNTNVYYYGTLKCNISKNGNGSIHANIGFSGANAWSKSWIIKKAQKFYLVKAWVLGSDKDGKTTRYGYRWVMYDDVLAKDLSLIEEADTAHEEIEVLDGEQKDKYEGFEEFSLKSLISSINYSSSFVIYFALKVIPLIGIICITLLLALSTISGIKIVRLFCDKFIDPVKILTLGKLTIYELSFQNAFFSMMLGYIGFALILNGNVLRVIQWLLEAYNVAVEIMKQM